MATTFSKIIPIAVAILKADSIITENKNNGRLPTFFWI